MITKITTVAKNKKIYHYGELSMDATQWSKRLLVSRNSFTHSVRTHGLKETIEKMQEQKRHVVKTIKRLESSGEQYHNEQLLNSLKSMGLVGKELESEFLKRAMNEPA